MSDLSQYRGAVLVCCSQSYLAQVETGVGFSLLHLDAAEVGSPNTLRRILDWARQKVSR